MSLSKNVHFESFYDQDQFCGFAYFAENKTTVYLTYLAVNSDLRGHGYGSRIIQMLEKRYTDKQIVIDIEPVIPGAKNYEQRIKRLKFYQHNGFHRTHHKLIDCDGEFETLATGEEFDKSGFTAVLKEMSLGFYKFKIEK